MNGVHLSGVLSDHRAGAWPGKGGQHDRDAIRPAVGRTVVQLSGGLDFAAAPALREHLIDVLHRGTGMLILDLSKVLSCDSAGLAVLIGTQRRARLLGTTMRLRAPVPRSRRFCTRRAWTAVFPSTPPEHAKV
jgi:anti-anti-sigma factor